VEDASGLVKEGKETLRIQNATQGYGFDVDIDLDKRERDIVVAGGRLNHF
jgi:hypothetical protein